MWEFVDHVIYINLDKRTQRNEHMKQFFKDGQIPHEKVTRFSAIQGTPGILGCMRSHIAVLEIAKRNNWKNVLILEDDVAWNRFEQNYKQLERLVSLPNWDVCMLGGLFGDMAGERVYSAIYAHAYLVNGHYYNTLLANLQQGLQMKLSHNGATQIFHNDVYWIKLQSRDTWYGVIDCLCIQIDGYSDNFNERSNTDVHNVEGAIFAKECRKMFMSNTFIGVVPKKFSLFPSKQLPR